MKVFKLKDITPSFSPRGSSLHQYFGAEQGASMASGITVFMDAEIHWKLWYDEMLLCLSLEKSFELVVDGIAHELEPGDMMWLPAGTELIYRSVGTTKAVWAVTPPDWEKQRPQGQAWRI
ncbi:hypothetical protein NKJ13_28360 [Mesorhizobium sp. M0174]|uniref:hypothetical protein n=1 Tax=Mesorhizobium sp. M0174 TaxID=2956904 RepID=UPI0033363261